MASIKDNAKGFKLINVSRTELLEHIGGYGICDHCNGASNSKGVYIAVLNHWVCTDCFDEWYNFATYYPEDSFIEEKNFEFYRNKLGLK